MAGAICGPKVSSAQCFRGIAAETWRANAHGRRLKVGRVGTALTARKARRPVCRRVRRSRPARRPTPRDRREAFDRSCMAGEHRVVFAEPVRLHGPKCRRRAPAGFGGGGAEPGAFGEAAKGGGRPRRTFGGIGRAAVGAGRRRFTEMATGAAGYRSGMAGVRFRRKLRRRFQKTACKGF